MTRLATRASSCEEPHRAIDVVSASHLIDDAAYPSTTLHSSTSLVSFREVSRFPVAVIITLFRTCVVTSRVYCSSVMLDQSPLY